jgi:hypothetical protein
MGGMLWSCTGILRGKGFCIYLCLGRSFPRNMSPEKQNNKNIIVKIDSRLCFWNLHGISLQLKFHVLRATSMKMAVFWDVASCSLVDINRRFWGAYCLRHQGYHQAIIVLMKQ